MRLAIIGERGIPARYSGFSTLIEQMSTRLVAQYGFEVTVYCRSHYFVERPARFKGVRCVYLPAPGGKSFESIIHSNLSIAHAFFSSYDLAFVLDPGNGPFVVPLRLRGLPIVMHTDGMGWKRQKWSPLQQRYYKWSESVTAKLSHWLVTDSEAMRKYYLDEYGADGTFIPYAGEVGNGLDASVLAEYGLAKGGYYLVVARIEPENNVHVVIGEYRAAKLEKPLVVVGDARYDTAYGRRIAAESDEKVRCIGSVYNANKLNALFSNSYAYLHGHEVGGTNPSLLNAMHLQAAPIAVDVVFHREVMGPQGLYFSAQEGNLAQILRNVDSNPQMVAELRSVAKFRSDSLYRWDAVVAAYAEMFERVVQAHARKRPLHEALNGRLYRPEDFFDGATAAPGG
jgi:glycosyltransferase involved in cell wall biosynthesis